MLAWQTRKEEICKSIPKIYLTEIKNIKHSKLFNQEFFDFYKSFQKSKGVKEAEIQKFLSKLDIPVLIDNDWEELEKDI